MPNALCLAVSQNENTFKECRIFMFNMLKSDKAMVLKLEDAPVEILLPYYVAFIESKGVNVQEAINCFNYEVPNSSYWDLLRITIVNVFRKLENNDYNYIPF